MGRRKLRKSKNKNKTARKRTPLRKHGSELDELRQRWGKLTRLERSRRFKALKRQGLSNRKVARLLGCSEKTVRDYLLLAELSKEARRAFAAGRLGRKRTLRSARAQRKLKAPTEEEKQAFISTCGVLLAAFIRRKVLSVYWEQFLQELKARSNWLRLQELSRKDSTATSVRLAEKPRKTLTRCRPGGRVPEYPPELISYCVDWLVNWFLWVLPSMEIREAVIERAEMLLRKEARR